MMNMERSTSQTHYGRINQQMKAKPHKAKIVKPEFATLSKDDDIMTEHSSTHSSYKELALAEEHGLRTSFRTVSKNDNPLSEPRLHVFSIPRDIKLDTPDSVISSGSVTLRNADGHTRFFNASHLQQDYNNKHSHDAPMFTPISENGTKMDDFDATHVKESAQSNNFFLGRSMRTQLRNESASRDRVDDNIRFINTQNVLSEKKHSLTDETKPQKGISCFPKLVLFCIILLMLVAGVVLLIYYKKEPAGDRKTGSVIPNTTEKPKTIYKEICPKVGLKLRDQISFQCYLEAADVLPHQVTHILVKPPIYWNKGKHFQIDINNKSNEWQAEIDNAYRILMINGSQTTCSTEGKFELEFYWNDMSQLNTSINIIVMSEVLRVNVSLSQDIKKYSDDFVLGCSTNSGCEPSSVYFFTELEDVDGEQELRGVNFSCTITYDDYHGYNVSCVGTIPSFLLAKFEKITCKPKSSILDIIDEDELSVEIELPECDLTTHCGYECINDSDYFVVSSGRCDIFHRCYAYQVATSYCAPGTFFDPDVCTCRHTRDLPWCQDNGALRPNSDVKGKTCAASNVTG